jgi:hypothetical protein
MRPRGRRLWWAAAVVTLLAVCISGSIVLYRLPSDPGEEVKFRADPASAADWTTRCGEPKAAALPVAPLMAFWQSDRELEPLTLARDGTIREKKIVASVSGACILDPRGGILLSVGADRLVRGPNREVVGRFEFLSRLTFGDVVISASESEVLEFEDGRAWGVGDDGGVFLVPDGPPPFGLPGGVQGEFSHARRTALLLLMMIGRV